MTSEDKTSIQLLQGTLDLMVLRTLPTIGPLHACAIGTRLEQVSENHLTLNQGTLYPALVRLEKYGWTKSAWGKTQNNRDAKYYRITKAGLKALSEEANRWGKMSALVEKLLTEES